MTQGQVLRQQSILSIAHHDYQKGLRSHAFYKVHDSVVSEDLVQDTFMRTWKYLVKGGKIEVMKAFLYHVLNGLIIDEYRKRKTLSLDLLLEKGFEPSSPSHDNLANFLERGTASTLIQCLPEKYQGVMHMRYIKGLSLEEMASITGQTKNTTAVQLHRGLEKLKIIYESQKNNQTG